MIGIYAAIPNVVGVIGMVLIGRSSDRTKERRWHFAGLHVSIAAVGLGLTIVQQGNFVGSLIGAVRRLDRHRLGDTAVLHHHQRVPVEPAAAGGIAMISSLGNLGAAVTPSITGAINTATGTPDLQHVPGDRAVPAVGRDAAVGGESRRTPHPKAAMASS